jgi:murein DD-endopeptidase MepM/ murein hydrolase activator NlpD
MHFHAPSRAHWLQLAACAVLAWAWFRGEPPADAVAPPTQDERAAGEVLAEAPVQVDEASMAPSEASLVSSIEVIVGRNDTLDRIFRRLELNLADLASLRALPEVRRTIDRLYPGEALTISHRDGALVGFERQLSESERLHVERQAEGFAANVIENPLEIELRSAEATIDTSLFAAAQSSAISDSIALAIADIFAWDIDFVLDIQAGDAFAVTYEQVFQDGEHVRDGAVLAVKFMNRGREYAAVRFTDADGKAGYYTPDGRSVRKAFLRAPVEFTRVSSRFNLYRRHPVLNRIRAHRGVDYAAPIGTPVRAAGDGRVQFRGVKGGYGKVVELAHANGVSTVYGHLSRFGKGAAPGRRVSQGEVIGYVGMSGLATGPHLHYEYRVRGVHKDPQKVSLPNAAPLDASQRAAFDAHAAPLLAALTLTAPSEAPVAPAPHVAAR